MKISTRWPVTTEPFPVLFSVALWPTEAHLIACGNQGVATYMFELCYADMEEAGFEPVPDTAGVYYAIATLRQTKCMEAGFTLTECRKLAAGEPLPHIPGPADCQHRAAIVHRTGGPSANDRNVCGACGQVIWRDHGAWVVDPLREAEMVKANATK